eukprot:CAMPEP_0185795764 /NCGR_PEP_ID=MMETSP1174-20130828/160720_1 /TAXON_ID=35687 /ORGANISM="Dictyocha speculum, Strain CCMP1381" /LENGTH=42 /DNA_ID= /DNA_START= /DNA_END= /DNA_ORIENTATION=
MAGESHIVLSDDALSEFANPALSAEEPFERRRRIQTQWSQHT